MTINEISARLTQPDAPDALVRQGLRALWRRETALTVIRGLAWTLAGLSMFSLLDLAVDWKFNLPRFARLLLLVVNLAGLSLLIHRQLLRRLRRYHPVELALRVERMTGDWEGRLVSCVEFGASAGTRAGISADLMQVVRRQASRRAAAINFPKIADTRRLRLTLRAAVPLIIIGLAAVFWQPRFFLVLGQRMLNPWTAAVYPTRTLIEMCSGNLTVRQADPVRLEARVSGEIPATGWLHIRYQGSRWERIEVPRQAGDAFVYVLNRGSDDFDYYFTLGDARSGQYRVTNTPPPHITGTQVELHYPSYTRLQTQTVNTMNLNFPEGTLVQWRLQLDRPVVAAEMLLEDQEIHPLALDPSGRTARLQLAPGASSSYTFRFRWKLGPSEYTDQAARSYIQIIPDADPQVGLLQPSEDTKATFSKVVDLVFWAKDDYGLGDARIVYALNDGGENRFALGVLGGQPSVERTLTWPIAKELTNLKEGDIVTFAVEVSDVRAGAGHYKRSRSRRIQFVSAADYLVYAQARQRRYLGQLRPLYLQELGAAAQIRALRSTAPSANTAGKERKP